MEISNVWNQQPVSLLLAKPPYKYGIQTYLVGGFNLPLWKNDGVNVSWDDDIPSIWKKNMFQTTNQLLIIHHY